MRSTTERIGRRDFLRAAAFGIVSVHGSRFLLGGGDENPSRAAVDIPFENTPGAKFEIVESCVSTFDAKPATHESRRDLGGMFRHEYEASVVERDAAGVATVLIAGRRGSGAYRGWGDRLVLYDSAEKAVLVSPPASDAKSLGDVLVKYGRHRIRARLSPRGEVVETWAGWRKPPEYLPARSASANADQLQRLFFPLPAGAVRAGESYETWHAPDFDPINSGQFGNGAPLDLGVRFEGVAGEVARFSLRGGLVADPSGESVALAASDYLKWIVRIDVDGVVDVDMKSGWVRTRDQTMIVRYRFHGRREDRAGPIEVSEVVNRRRLIVTGKRIT